MVRVEMWVSDGERILAGSLISPSSSRRNSTLHLESENCLQRWPSTLCNILTLSGEALSPLFPPVSIYSNNTKHVCRCIYELCTIGKVKNNNSSKRETC